MTDAAAQRLNNARLLRQLHELTTGRVAAWAAPAREHQRFAEALDRHTSVGYRRFAAGHRVVMSTPGTWIPYDTGALTEALTTPGHPNKRVIWGGKRPRYAVVVWHPCPVYRPDLMPPFPAEAVRLAFEEVRVER